VKVHELIEKLQKMPQDADLQIDVSAYYYDGDIAEINEPKLTYYGTVSIGEVCAQP
jgi:hypothetical protein